jgi:hypothetical protein
MSLKMALSVEQIKQLIEDKPKRSEIAKALVHHSRLKFHSETQIERNDLSSYYQTFISWICTEKPEILPKDKVERFKQLLTTPLPTNQLVESIEMAWSRIFEAENAFCRYDFADSELLADWEEYRDMEFWKTDGFKAMMTAIDSVWVVDLPSEQEGDRPEPKNMLIDISNVLDISVNKNAECNYVIFSLNEKLFVYDDETIRSFDFKDKEIGEELSNFPHELGYCPARMFWTTLLNSKNFINHKAPLTNVLSELDWLLVHKTFKKYMDVANSWPILVAYQTGGDSSDLTLTENKGRTEAGQQTLGKGMPGPGTILEMPLPIEGQPDLMANPIKWIAPEVNTLQFHVSEDDRLTDNIFKTAVGVDGEQKNDQAKNEKQVLASFESQSIILKRIAMNFEKIQCFADRVCIGLRYGQDVNCSIDYGNKFFLKTVEDLTEEIESVKTDDVMLSAVYDELIETKFRNDSAGKTRAYVLRDLDPAPCKGMEEVITMKEKGGITEDDFRIKCNFMNYVLRFEREQLPIDQFMSKGDYNERVKKIKDEFLKYAGEGKTEEMKEPKQGVPPEVPEEQVLINNGENE